MSNFILLENRLAHSKNKSSFLFQNPSFEWCCYSPEHLMSCLLEIQEAQKKGFYLVGYLAYEASYFLNSILKEPYTWNLSRPLLHFFGFVKPSMLNEQGVEIFLGEQFSESQEKFFYEHLILMTSKERYFRQFKNLRDHLYNGDSYQINLTTKYKFDYQGSPINLYQQCRQQQKVAFGGVLQFPNETIISLSPELFFRKKGNLFETKPMKGTMPRSKDTKLDLQYKSSLKSNPKIVSENTIIVDLLRNDLSTISEPGSVEVTELFSLETYDTLHQMTSHICSKVKEELSFIEIIQNIFPCGSITGAPKKRTMQIIHEQELEPRHVYTGCIGYITPQNDMCFNVAIRSFYLNNGLGELGVGGGVVFDSNAEDEYAELQLKAKFFISTNKSFKLIESILYQPHSGYFLLEEHLQRLKNSAKTLGFSYLENDIRQALSNLESQMLYHDSYKVRLILEKKGEYTLEIHQLNKLANYLKIYLYTKEFLKNHETLISHKTIDSPIRHFYENIKADYSDYHDVVFINEQQQITESCYANIFIVKNNRWYTPPSSVGLLPGLMRQHLLNTKPNITEKILYPEDLAEADQIFLANSVRGLVEVKLCLNY